MMTDYNLNPEDPSFDLNEHIVRAYFDHRPGWAVAKLDSVNQLACDYRFSCETYSFLCEVKTVESVHANYPSTPLQLHLDERKTWQNRINEWKEKDPETNLLLTKDRYDYIFGDETKFRRRFQYRRRNTEKEFNNFSIKLRSYLIPSPKDAIPYRLRIDSDNLYAPTPEERKILLSG